MKRYTAYSFFIISILAFVLACGGNSQVAENEEGRPDRNFDAASQKLGIPILSHPEISVTNDFEGIAGLIEASDLVVSVGNATAHLAGALGKQTWVLLPSVPGWRWMRDGHKSGWYQSVTLFRQQGRDAWGGVLAEVQEALRQQS